VNPFGFIATGIVAFTAITSYFYMAVLPFHLGRFALPLMLVKLSIVAFWLYSAWRVKRKRERGFARREADGTLWNGPIEAENLNISPRDLEVIRYRFDRNEKVIRIDRQHKFLLWHAVADFAVMGVLILAALVLLKYYPAFHHSVPPSKILHEGRGEASFPVWWIPLLPVLYFFYEGLADWQDWKWTIRAITDKHFYIFREQSTYMAWTNKNFRSIPVHQIISIRSSADNVGGMVGWGTLELEVRADEHGDKREDITVDYVADEDEFERQLRNVLPAYGSALPAPQPVVSVPAPAVGPSAERD
jgi:hypothetical protein